MKRRQFVALFIFIAGMIAGHVTKAQGKIGYISLQELIVQMPEYKQAENDMSDYQQALQQQSNDYQFEYMRKDSLFKADSSKWSPAMREVKRKELNELSLKFINFGREAQQLIANREQELLAPIQTRAVNTVQQVAKKNGYQYILSKETLIAFPPDGDVFPLAAKELGLKIEKPAPPKTDSK